MKRIFLGILLLASACAAQAQFTANAMRIQQRDSANSSFWARDVLPTVTDGILIYNATTMLPQLVTLGPNLSIVGSVLDAAGSGAPTSGQIITALGFTPYDASNPSGFVTGSALTSALSSYATTSALTTGLAGKFSTPAGTISQYVRGDGTLAAFPAVGSGTVTSVGVTSSNLTVTGSPVTTSGSIAVSLPNVGTAGTYNGSFTTDATGRVTSAAALTINDTPGRSLVTSTSATGYQISSTRTAQVCYEGSFATTSTIGGPASATVFLETAATNSTTPSDWTIKAQQTYTNTITLAVVLNQVQGNNWSICRFIAAGAYVRIRSGSISGTASVSLNATQQENQF